MVSERFAYQVLDLKAGVWGLKAQKVQDELNRLGAQGWELVTAAQANGFGLRLILKRAH
jgi:hypothetical protein